MTTVVSKLLLTFGVHVALKKHNIRDLKELRQKRVGEIWAACHDNNHDDKYYTTWQSLVKLMIEHGLRFKDCDPKRVDLAAVGMPRRFTKLSKDAYRPLNLYGPTTIEVYDYLTLQDLEMVLPRFDDALRAELKEFLTDCRPKAPLLKDL